MGLKDFSATKTQGHQALIRINKTSMPLSYGINPSGFYKAVKENKRLTP